MLMSATQELEIEKKLLWKYDEARQSHETDWLPKNCFNALF